MTFELRTYTANDGKLDALVSRFRDHTVSLFERHGMSSIGYWIPVDQADTIVYLLKHDGDPEDNWDAFRADEDWLAVKTTSEAEGPLTAKIVSVFMQPTDFSAIA